MKKYILSPLCSALVIPGLGQILNHQNAKGLILLAIIFFLTLAGCVQLFLAVKSLVAHADVIEFSTKSILLRIEKESPFSFLYVLLSFTAVWIYAVVDAFWTGLKLERHGKEKQT